MFAYHFSRELRGLFSTPMRLAAIVAYVLLIVWATAAGIAWQRDAAGVQAAVPADLLTERAEWFDDLRRIEAGEDVSPYAARPMNLTFLALHPPGELSALAYRNEGLQPHTALINGWRSEALLFRRYEVEGPAALRAGRIDLAFVVVAVLPLVLLLLSSDVLSRERASGRMALFLSQGGRPGALLTARLAAAGLVVTLPAVIAVVTASLIVGAPAGAAAAWIAVVLAYCAFWIGLSGLVAAASATPERSAIAGLAVWAVVVILIPSAAQFTAQAVHPLPSRVAYLTESRLAEGATRRNLEERAEIYMAEHPGQSDTPDSEVPGFYTSSYLANYDINVQTAPIVERLEERQDAQRELVSLIEFLSPAISANRLFEGVSGTGPEHAAAFRRQARDQLGIVLEAIGPATVGRSRISVAEAEAIPEFAFAPPERPSLLPLAWLAGLAVILLMVALRVSRRVV